MIAAIHLFTPDGENLATVMVHDLLPFVTLALREPTVDLTRPQARQLGDILRAVALRSPAEILESWPSWTVEGE